MDFVFRSYRPCDKKACCRIIAPTWRFDVYFPNIRNTERLCEFVFDMFLLKSDYTDVALCSQGVPAGFAFAVIKEQGILRKAKKNSVFALFFIKNLFLWLTGFYGNLSAAWEIFRTYSLAQKHLLQGIRFDAELLCLFVDSKWQGLGLGRRLLGRFYKWAKGQKSERIVLTTDTDCNYRFYDSCGFRRLREIDGCLGISANTGKESRIFVYARSL